MSRLIFNMILLSLCITLAGACIETDDDNDVSGIVLDGSWLFLKADSSISAEVERRLIGGGSIAGSERVMLPHAGSMFDSIAGQFKLHGKCYYYRKFMVPDDMEGKRMSLLFEGAVYHAEVWTNGVRCAVHYGSLPFVVDFKPVSGENNVVVKLDYGGAICNKVWLVAKDSLSITNEYEVFDIAGGIVVDAHCTAEDAGALTISALVRNSYSESRRAHLNYRVLDHNGKEMGKGRISKTLNGGEEAVFVDSLTIDGITPWDIDNPWLYSLDTQLESDGDIVDTKKVTFGFRDIAMTADSFALNGRERLLRGVRYKVGYPLVGVAVGGNACKRDAYKIKRGGFNLVVPTDNMPPEQFLTACDHYGLFVAETTPDSYSRNRSNHPCLVPASFGTIKQSVYGCEASADIVGSEAELVMQSQKMASELNDIVPQYWAGTLCNMYDNASDHTGVMSENRMPKFSYYFCQSQGDIDEEELQAFADPVCVIASYWIPGQSKGVRVYGNCHQVELFVDGVSVGRRPPEMSPSSVNLPHPSFYFDVDCTKPGTLKAFGYDKDDAPIAECVVSTPDTPVRLKLVLDESGTHIGANDIIMVHCYVLDGNGNTVVTCNDEVEFAVT
nr:DUF4982 domain-containing protein [Bacteroidales bacterium]